MALKDVESLTMARRIYFENLDGLRFICFLSVFFFHSFHTDFDHIKSSDTYHLIKYDIFGNGNLGVNFFFVLSGFLITYLLIEEKKLNGQIDVKKFWVRRILRIWPLYYLCVMLGFFIFPWLKSAFGQEPRETASIVYYLTFTNNFDFIKNGPPDASVLGVLWSVAIEEQFYVVWPIILYLLPIRKYWVAFTTVIVASLVFRALNDNSMAYEHHTLSCISDMAVGAFGAWLVQTSENFKLRISTLKRSYISLIYILFLTVFVFRDEILSQRVCGLNVIERPIIALIILLIILEQCFSSESLFKMSRFKFITKMGAISYGLYCFHFVGILIAITLTERLALNTEFWQVFFVDTSIALALTIAMSWISYRVYEKPFLRLKNKFAYIKTK